MGLTFLFTDINAFKYTCGGLADGKVGGGHSGGLGGEFGKGKKWSGGYVQVTTHLFFLFLNLMEK